MIVSTLKSNSQGSMLILSMLALILWGLTFWYNPNQITLYDHSEHILYNLLFAGKTTFILRQIISLVIISLGAFITNYICISQEIVSKTNYLPAFFYLFIAFSAADNTAIEPILISNIFILPALYFLINSYRQEQALSDFFNTGILMSVASFFYINYVIVFPLSYVAMFILRPFNWREWALLTIGLFTPLYIYDGINYLVNKPILEVFNLTLEKMTHFKQPVLSEYYILFLFVIITLMIFAFFLYITKGIGGKVKTQKSKFVLIWMLFFCLTIPFLEQTTEMILLPCIVPISILLGDYFFSIKKVKIASTLLILLIGSFLIISLHQIGLI
jgi:hypothetical protein